MAMVLSKKSGLCTHNTKCLGLSIKFGKTLVCETVHHDFVRKFCCGKQRGKCSICVQKTTIVLKVKKKKFQKKFNGVFLSTKV
jgi:hypothetical protein